MKMNFYSGKYVFTSFCHFKWKIESDLFLMDGIYRGFYHLSAETAKPC